MAESVVFDQPQMTLRHAASKTGLSATTLRRYIKEGRLPARLVPGRFGPEYVVGDDDLRLADLHGHAPADGHTGATRFGAATAAMPEPAGATRFGAATAATAAMPEPAGAAAGGAEFHEARMPVRPAPAPAPPAPPWAGEAVPGLLYRELLMKHEHLLVQFGMLRVSGQQVLELRQDAQRRESEARRIVEELAQIRDRHAREIGVLKAKLRQAELAIAARDHENQALQAELRRLEIAQRNAITAGAMDEQFARRVTRPPLEDN